MNTTMNTTQLEEQIQTIRCTAFWATETQRTAVCRSIVRVIVQWENTPIASEVFLEDTLLSVREELCERNPDMEWVSTTLFGLMGSINYLIS